MKLLIVSALVLTSCLAHSQKGKFCYSWADKQGMTHTTCETTKPKCVLSKDRRNEQYQTISTCEKR